jgi:putative endonuclease
MIEKIGWVYILTNRPNGIFYAGVTSGLIRRIAEHREGQIAGFTQRYGLKLLAYFEMHDDILSAIAREKAIKDRKRAYKTRLIMTANPDWNDLYPGLL